MRKFFTVAIISAIYFAWIGGVCLADGGMLRRTWTLVPATPVIGPLGDGIYGPEYYPPAPELTILGFSFTTVGTADTIEGTGSNGDSHRITPVVDYYAETGQVTIRGYNAKTGSFDPSADWKDVWIQSGYPVFNGDESNFSTNATHTVDTDDLVAFVLPNPESFPGGIFDYGRIAQAGLSESDFLAQSWTITGNAKSSFDDRGNSSPSFVGGVARYNAAPVPEPTFAGMAIPVVLFGFLRLWLLGRRMR